MVVGRVVGNPAGLIWKMRPMKPRARKATIEALDPLGEPDSLDAATTQALGEWFEQQRYNITERLGYIDHMGRTRKRDMTSAVGYVRVSTEQQVKSGAGLEAQRAAITQACEQRGLVLTQTLADEGVSGKGLGKRDGLAQALDQLRSGQASVLVVSKLDRLSRSVIDFAKLLDQARDEGWRIVVLNIGVDMTTSHGRFIANVMSAAAQWERELISERTSEALLVKVAQGVPVGRPHAVPSDVVERIHQARSSGSTFRAIADALNDDQIPTGRGGKQWYPASVRAVLNRKRVS